VVRATRETFVGFENAAKKHPHQPYDFYLERMVRYLGQESERSRLDLTLLDLHRELKLLENAFPAVEAYQRQLDPETRNKGCSLSGLQCLQYLELQGAAKASQHFCSGLWLFF
jgi:hypothetical protein